MTRAFVFPGQGSQAVGMGRELCENFKIAREVLEEVDDALGEKLSAVIDAGPEATLTLTENAQPAIMAVSIAVLRVLQAEAGLDLAGSAKFVAGHSLGEYSALCAAGTLGLADTARLLRLRGRAMQQAVPVGEGAMAALLGADMQMVQEIVADAAEGQVCAVANDNAPGQVVVSGHRDAVERAITIGADRGYRRSVRLPVSAPFHCPLMQPAADAMAEALAGVDMRAPVVPLVANVTAAPVTDPEEIRRLLVAQVTGQVRWRESVLFMRAAGVAELVELGAGKVLAGLAKRIDRDLAALSIGTPADVDAFRARQA